MAWFGLFTRRFQESLDASDRSLTLIPSDLVPTTNRAHALMFLGRTEEARAIYRAHVGEPLQGKKWENVIVEDFAKLRAAKLTNPLMAEIEAAFPPLPAPTATNSPTASSPTPVSDLGTHPTPTPTPSYSALATLEPVPTHESRTPRIFDNYDLAGNDLGHAPADSMDSCVSQCQTRFGCEGVTYDKWNRVCFLKSEAKMLWFDAKGTAAIMDPTTRPAYSDEPMHVLRYPGRAFPKTGEMSYAESADACADTCKDTGWCAAGSFFRSTHQCMMLRTTGEYFRDSDAESSAKRQTNY